MRVADVDLSTLDLATVPTVPSTAALPLSIVNPAPVMTLNAATATVATFTPFPSFQITDNDNDTEKVTIYSTAALSFAGKAASVTVASTSSDKGSYLYEYTLDSTSRTDLAAAVAAAKGTFTSNAAVNYEVMVSDGYTSSSSGTKSVSPSVLAAPVIGGVMAAVGNDDAQSNPFSAMTITAAEADAVVAVTITMTASPIVANVGVLAGAGLMSAANGTYTLSGTGSTIQALLRQLVFTPKANQLVPGTTETVAFSLLAEASLAGQTMTTAATQSVTLTSVNDPTTIGGLTDQSSYIGTVITPLANITVADPDVGQTFNVTVNATNGGQVYNSATSSWGTSVSYSGGTDLAALQTQLRALQYRSSTAIRDSLTVAITTTSGDTATRSEAIDVTLPPKPSSPMVSLDPSSLQDTDASWAIFNNAVIVSDPGSTVTVTIDMSTTNLGTLTYAGSAVFSGAGTSVYMLSASAADIQAALRAVTFTPAKNAVAPGLPTVVFSVSATAANAGGTSSAWSTQTTVTVTSVNDTPVIMGLAASQTVYSGASLQAFKNAVVTDPDIGQQETVTVTLGDKAAGALAASAGTGTYDAATGSYTITDSVANVQTALESLLFTSTATYTGKVDLTVKIVDGYDATLKNTYTTSVTVGTVPPPSPPTPTVTVIDDSTMSTPQRVVLTGTKDEDVIGGSGDDVVCGNAGANKINGGPGNNQLWGAGGNDTLVGGTATAGGNDSNGFWWGLGDGHDVIELGTQSNQDAVILYNSSTAGLSLGQSGEDLIFQAQDGGTLTLTSWYGEAAASRLQSWIFENTAFAWNDGEGTVVNLSNASFSLKEIHQVTALDAGGSTLIGSAGGDVLTGSSSSGQLWGAGGNDTLVAATGTTGLWWGLGDGRDVIRTGTDSSQDAVILYNSSTAGLTVGQSGEDLVFQAQDGATLTVAGWYAAAATERIQSWVFEDTALAWNDGAAAVVNLMKDCYALKDIHKATAGDGYAATLVGSSSSDVLTAGSGGGNLWGAAGADTVIGGSGHDMFWWGGGDGKDVIAASALSSGDTVKIYSHSVADVTSAVVGQDLVIWIQGDSADALTIQNWAAGGGSQISNFIIGSKNYRLGADGATWREA